MHFGLQLSVSAGLCSTACIACIAWHSTDLLANSTEATFRRTFAADTPAQAYMLEGKVTRATVPTTIEITNVYHKHIVQAMSAETTRPTRDILQLMRSGTAKASLASVSSALLPSDCDSICDFSGAL